MDQHTDEKKSENRLAWGRGRMAFMAQQARIAKMLGEGWPQTMIYKELEPHLNGLSYSQFSMHIRKNILKTQKTGASHPQSTSIPEQAQQVLPEPVKPTEQNQHPLKSQALKALYRDLKTQIPKTFGNRF